MSLTAEEAQFVVTLEPAEGGCRVSWEIRSLRGGARREPRPVSMTFHDLDAAQAWAILEARHRGFRDIVVRKRRAAAGGEGVARGAAKRA